METAQQIENAPVSSEPVESGAVPRSVDWDNPRVSSILAAAAKCFARRGFNATTLAEIGKELGLRKSIVHYYFASKAALVQEVQSFFYKRYLRGIRDALTTNGAQTSLTEALSSLRSNAEENSTANGLNIEIWSAARRDPEIRRRAAALQAEARHELGQRLANEVSAPDAVAALTLAVLDGLAVAEEIDGDPAKAKAAFEAYVALVSAGSRSAA